MKNNKVFTLLKENMMLKEELKRIMELANENEAKKKGFSLVEDAFLTSESIYEIDAKALAYMEEVFEIDRAVLFLDETFYNFGTEEGELKRILFISPSYLDYAYPEKRPYFGSNVEGLVSAFLVVNGVKSFLTAPIAENGKIIGSLNLYSKQAARFAGKAHADFVKDFMIRVWITLRTLHNAYILLNYGKYDPLTGIYNKSAMDSHLANFVERYRRTNEGFTLMIADLDNFGHLNNIHGHSEADRFLFILAENFSHIIEKQEILGRFGGDEFYFILDSIDPDVIKGKFDKISKETRAAAEKFDLGDIISISAGYVRVPLDTRAAPEKTGEIVRRADNALRHSKAFGTKLSDASKERSAVDE
ncbi:MAG: sensor domain-containing diguanylate cyclase [Deferribacteraceae bacterium]|jgi:diguanylate cyclase (GGDEF)-like protein|nr:sensor domain-containing diguanylate cyclase [Deferribacteraceae bacterium]